MRTARPARLTTFDYLGPYRYFSVIAYCFMPDHVHFLVEDAGYERVLRDEESTVNVARYILENPVRAGLVRQVSEYPFVGSQACSVKDLLDGLPIGQGILLETMDDGRWTMDDGRWTAIPPVASSGSRRSAGRSRLREESPCACKSGAQVRESRVTPAQTSRRQRGRERRSPVLFAARRCA